MTKYFLIGISICLFAECQEQPKQVTAATQVPQYTIEQFYKSTSVGGGSFSSDDKRILVNSDENGIYNAYEIDLASGQKKALTTSTKESTFGNDYLPGRSDFIYSSDKGGNENSHLFLQRANGQVKELTTGEKEKAGFIDWSKDDKYMYYTSNKRDARFFDLYKADTTTWN